MHNAKYVLHSETPDIVLQSVFKKYDDDGSGELDIEEFSDALNDLGVIDEHEQKAIFHLADADNGGTVCINEFIQLIKGHEFDNILASHDELEFIYQTHKQFEKYDADGNGEISWDEFYFYLTKQNYTHQQISQNWHYLDVDKNSKVTFDEFWKGYKAMAEAQQKQMQQNDNDSDDEKNDNKNKKAKAKVIPHLEHQSFSNKEDDTNILHSAKNKLKKSTHKMNKSKFKSKVGKVVDEDDEKDENNVEKNDVKEYKVYKRPKDDST